MALQADRPAADVLELGPGPGVLLGLLARGPGLRRVIGVEPSTDMPASAARALRVEIAAGLVELRAGSAAETGLPDSSVDLAVSVNTVAENRPGRPGGWCCRSSSRAGSRRCCAGASVWSRGCSPGGARCSEQRGATEGR